MKPKWSLAVTLVLALGLVGGFQNCMAPSFDKPVKIDSSSSLGQTIFKQLNGNWGGTGVSTVLLDSGSDWEFDCAHASITHAFMVAENGTFDTDGTYTFEHGGPIHEGEDPNTHPARFHGTTDGKTMSLQIDIPDTGTTIGPVDLTLDGSGRIVKCL